MIENKYPNNNITVEVKNSENVYVTLLDSGKLSHSKPEGKTSASRSKVEDIIGDEEKLQYDIRYERFIFILLALIFVDYHLFIFFADNIYAQFVFIFLQFLLIISFAVLWELQEILNCLRAFIYVAKSIAKFLADDK